MSISRKKAIDRGTIPLLSCFGCRRAISKHRFQVVGRICRYCQEKIKDRPGQRVDLGDGWSIGRAPEIFVFEHDKTGELYFSAEKSSKDAQWKHVDSFVHLKDAREKYPKANDLRPLGADVDEEME